ncbi:MAG: DUF3604 domain-containing protein [Phycisphaerales bacterium]|nr:MAG: DUF3604 domain-containing protein [Phycisphaerales bacterium]
MKSIACGASHTTQMKGQTMSSEDRINRRRFLKNSATVGAGMALSAGTPVIQSSVSAEPARSSAMNLYWGDLHNHCAVGYARGSLERAYDIAQSHLDFFCFTGHSQWHDMPKMPQDKHLKWVRGFEVTKENWAKVKRLAGEYHQPGKFVPFIGYEWHSSSYGDVCIIFPEDQAELVYIDGVKEFQEFARGAGAILIPHHPGYLEGWRGQNWSVLHTGVSPVVEIFSEHGNAESDRGPHRYIRHSMGGRFTQNTLQWLWAQGVKVGVVASTDDHLGYPGAYGEGLVAVHAESLTRQSILEAIKARRTYGVSADRIELAFRLNGHWMGEVIGATAARYICVKVKGKDVIDRVEVLRNNRVIHRAHPIDRMVRPSSWDKPVLCRIEYGWGPWGDLKMARICDWKFVVTIDDGRIISATPCFQSGPFDEQRRNRLTTVDEKRCEVTSYTSRMNAYEERATNSIILEIQGSPRTQLAVAMTEPTRMDFKKSLAQLANSSDVKFTGPFTSESVLLPRITFAGNYESEFEITDRQKTDKTDWYYVRVVQANGGLAWSSPIWVEAGT